MKKILPCILFFISFNLHSQPPLRTDTVAHAIDKNLINAGNEFRSASRLIRLGMIANIIGTAAFLAGDIVFNKPASPTVASLNSYNNKVKTLRTVGAVVAVAGFAITFDGIAGIGRAGRKLAAKE